MCAVLLWNKFLSPCSVTCTLFAQQCRGKKKSFFAVLLFLIICVACASDEKSHHLENIIMYNVRVLLTATATYGICGAVWWALWQGEPSEKAEGSASGRIRSREMKEDNLWFFLLPPLPLSASIQPSAASTRALYFYKREKWWQGVLFELQKKKTNSSRSPEYKWTT